MTNQDIAAQKQLIRSEMRNTLKSLSSDQRSSASAAICQQITQLLDSPPIIIASFAGLRSEPDLSSLHQLLPKHTIVYPHSKPAGEMNFHKASDYQSLEKGLYGILQPADNTETLVPASDIDLFLCPGLAFTNTGQRLGKGGGYYDRLLAQRNPLSKLVGICFKEQILTHLPTDHHDIHVDQVISD